VGVTDDSLNGAPYEQSPSTTEEESEADDEDGKYFSIMCSGGMCRITSNTAAAFSRPHD